MSSSLQKVKPANSLEKFIKGNRIYREISAGIACGLVKLIYRIEYVNRENMPTSGPALLVANHTSLIDILAIKYPIKTWTYYVAKKQLFDTPIFGNFFHAMGCIAVDRDKVDLHAARGIFGVLNDRKIVGMFPQGTRIPDDQILTSLPRTGVAHFAIKTGAPIIPVLVDGHFSLTKKTKIIFGPAFTLDADSRKRYNHAELMEYTVSIMQKVYDLKGFDYTLKASALLEDGIVRREDGRLTLATDAEKAAHSFLKSCGQTEKT
ncbi:MAG: lysophospholipid acyltransferase family protein [Eubacteriales bacterium]|nr:lysophospholipid acyltransferase family protein [Eubacteriales bacterium]